MSHFDELTFLRYLDGELEPRRRLELKAHLQACPSCREHLAALERESNLLREALSEADEALPARLQESREGELSWAILGAAGFAAGGLYTLWNWIFLPWWERLQSVGMGYETVLAVVVFRAALWKGWAMMEERLILWMTATALVVLAAALARWGWRRWSSTAVLVGLLVSLLASPRAAGAAEIKTNLENYWLPAGEVVENDLVVFAHTARVEGTVEGDLILFAQSATLGGRVRGDVIAFAKRLNLQGEVDGNVRSLTQFLTLRGPVARNVTSGAEELEFDSKSRVAGSLTFFGATANLDGHIERDLMAFAGTHHLNGFIGGSALLAGERLAIGPMAEIRGQARFRGGKQPEVSPQASLASPLDVQIKKKPPAYASPRFYWRQALKWAAAFVFGLALALLMPGLFAETLRSGRRYGLSFGVGAVALIAVPIMAVIACITIVGLAVGLTALLVYALALYAAQVFVATWLGQQILGEAGSRAATLKRLAVGLVIIHAAGHVPYAGELAWLAVILWGLGALSLAAYRRARPELAAA